MALLSFPFSKRKQFEKSLSPFLPKLYKRAYHLTQSQDEAQDLLQELLLKLYEQPSRLEEVKELEPWLMRILYNLFVDRWRKQKLEHVFVSLDDDENVSQTLEIDLVEATTSDITPEKAAMKGDFYNNLQEGLLRLTADHRILIVMHDIEGHTLNEIQEELSLPLGTIKSRLHRARTNLREILVR